MNQNTHENKKKQKTQTKIIALLSAWVLLVAVAAGAAYLRKESLDKLEIRLVIFVQFSLFSQLIHGENFQFDFPVCAVCPRHANNVSNAH